MGLVFTGALADVRFPFSSPSLRGLTMEQLLPFLLFAFVASITPGPTNILVLSNASRFGLGAALPIVLGACCAAAAIVLLVGLGLGEVLARHPMLQRAMAWAGIAWLSWLAWQILRSEARSLDDPAEPGTRLGLGGAIGLQLVNPKVWMMALAVVGVFAGEGADKAARVVTLSLAFLLVSIPCMGAWALLGLGSARLWRSAAAQKRFNQAMALLLLASAWLSLVV